MTDDSLKASYVLRKVFLRLYGLALYEYALDLLTCQLVSLNRIGMIDAVIQESLLICLFGVWSELRFQTKFCLFFYRPRAEAHPTRRSLRSPFYKVISGCYCSRFEPFMNRQTRSFNKVILIKYKR